MRPQARFLDLDDRQLYLIEYPPAPAPSGWVVVAAPFAEEMNRSRRMVALLARRLAAHGWGTAVVDLYGTGDSGGEFADARWATWRADFAAVIDRVRARGAGPVALLGIRLGALLALDSLQRGTATADRLLLWQPVTEGRRFITQFLRVYVAAALAREGERRSTRELRAGLEAGEPLEVAGYCLTRELVAAIDELNLTRLAPPAAVRVEWFELGAAGADALSPVSARALEAWAQHEVDIAVTTLAGEPFWAIQETTVVPALVDATVAAVTGRA